MLFIFFIIVLETVKEEGGIQSEKEIENKSKNCRKQL
jgi:hypothetical protein